MENGDHPINVTVTVMMPGEGNTTVQKGTVTATDELSLDALRREMKRTRCLSLTKHDGTIVEIQGILYDHALIQFTPHKPKKERAPEVEQQEPPEHESQVATGAVTNGHERGSMAGADKPRTRKPPTRHRGESENVTDRISEFNKSNHMGHGSRKKVSNH